MANYGFIYVLRNECMPGIYKIGMTDRSPSNRCEELSRSTSVPLPFEIVCFGETSDALEAERSMHEAFAANRINTGREFFVFSGDELGAVFCAIEENTSFVAYGDMSFLCDSWCRPILRGAFSNVLSTKLDALESLPSRASRVIAKAMADAAREGV